MSLRPTRPSSYQEKLNFPKKDFNLKRVYDIILDPNHPLYRNPDSIGVIFFGDLHTEENTADSSILPQAKPIDINNFQYPLIGEIVEVMSSVTGDAYYSDMGGDPKFISNYYRPSINIHSNIASNSLPIISNNSDNNVEDYKFKNLQKDTPSTQYKFEIEGQTRESARRNLDNYLYELGFIGGKDSPNAPRYDLFQRPNGSFIYKLINPSTDQSLKLGNYFKENSSIKSLLPMEGDSLYQGRNGQSIRFSTTTPNGINPWSSNVTDSIDDGNPSVGDPVVLIRTTSPQDESQESIVEDINNDAASIYLFSKQGLVNFVPSSTNISSLKSEYTPVPSSFDVISKLPIIEVQTPPNPPTTSNVEFTSSANNIVEPTLILIPKAEIIPSGDPVFDALDEAVAEDLLTYNEITYSDSDYDIVYDESNLGVAIIPPPSTAISNTDINLAPFDLNYTKITTLNRNDFIRPTEIGIISNANGAFPFNSSTYRGQNEFGGFRGLYEDNQLNRDRKRVGQPRWHYGTDISTGTKQNTSKHLNLLAIADATIIIISNFRCIDGKNDNCGLWKSYGNSIVIKLTKYPDYLVHYAHCRMNSVQLNPRTNQKWKNGDLVKQGEVLALMGDTGGSKGVHLHLEFIYMPNAQVGSSSVVGSPKDKRDPQSVYSEFRKGYKYNTAR
jgi:murein DD-endopeptidase MepM/ murein hydrolase activator NlpD